MKMFRLRSLALLAAMASGFAGARASADELVVMPYTCHVAGDRPQLVPSENVGHRILGRRDTTSFTACSPARPDQCRRWAVHRFDVDCGGRAVSWPDVVASGSGSRRAWVGRDGVFRIRMPAWWAMQPDDPCYTGGAPYERFRPGVMRRLCADREARGEDEALATVAFPPGYAPTFGLDAIFVPAPPTPGGGAMASAETPRGPLPFTERPGLGPSRPAASEPQPPKPAEAVRPSKPAPATTGALQTPPQPKANQPVARAVETTPQQQPQPETRSHAASTANQGPDGNQAGAIVPRILNAPAEPPSAAAPAVKNPPAPAPAPEPATGPATSQVAEPAPASRPPEPPTTVSLTEGTETDYTPLIVAAASAGGLLVLAGAVAFLVMAGRRSEASRLPERDLHAVRLGDEPRPVSRQALAVGRPAVPPPVLPAHRPPPVRGDFATVPSTAEEALAILGVGVDPAADLVAIKKMVDALRFSWHPDRAQDAEDRQLRELRIRQINAAWDILSARSQSRRSA